MCEQEKESVGGGSDADGSERIRELIAAVQNGGTNADGDAFGALMERYLPLIERTVNRFSGELPSDADREDLRQEALMSFYRATISYDLSREGVSFGLYAQICMTNRLVSCLRLWKRREEGQTLLGEEDIPAAERSAEDPVASLEAEERLEMLYAVIRRVLSPFEYRIWEHYVRGLAAKEIAVLVGKSEKSVTNAIGRIRKKLRDARAEFDF